ncbi:MFS transporter [Halodesulfovibrio spirochaetisodalis]|uniref:Membrane protein n=1 Tax=Halodesulfovibrio spirochaetisodalis TaxID=1560234 RepID=A0A1B7XBU4_9BACT|nr:MFS transporter [Halodesulfovibrio spirochaetisodalis]OBQ50235.1 membrane protein [Halodesulfovibrio spirochaetisodalis]
MSDADRRRMYIFLLVMTVAVAAGFQAWRTLYNNFAVDIVGLTGQQIGIIQSVREIPGFLALLVIYLLLFIAEHRLAALSIAILGLGVGLTGSMPTYHGMIITTLIMSFGFHYYETVNQSLTLQYFSLKEAPVIMGKLRAMGSATNLVVGGAIFLLSMKLDFQQLFWLFGILVILAAGWCLTQNPTSKNIPPQHKKMVLRWRYWLFYMLNFLAGARRQIFVAFAVFLMVDKFQFTIQEVTLLFIANNVINWWLSPAIGRAVNTYGERKVLTLEYAAMVFVFVSYAYVESKILVAFLYVLDHIFFNFSLAIKSYFQKIADPTDIAPSMAVSFTINHIAAVVVPALGGMLWMVDYKIPFLGAAGISVMSLILVQFIRTPDAE